MNMNFDEKEEDFVLENADGADDSVDEDETGESLLPRLEKLKKALQVCTKERKEYLEGWQRVKADYLNSKKRYDEERKEIISRAEISSIEKLLPLCDSFDMALAHMNGQKQEGVLETGFAQIHAQLLSILAEFKVTEIKAEGKAFDPYQHEALSSIAVSTKEQHDMVISVLQKGYMRNDTLVRPAKVIIGVFTE